MSMFADFKTADKAPSVNKAAAAASDRNANELAKYNDRKVKTNTAIGIVSLINPWVGAALKAGEVATDEGADQEVVPLDSAAVRGESGGETAEFGSATDAGLSAARGDTGHQIGGQSVDLGIDNNMGVSQQPMQVQPINYDIQADTQSPVLSGGVGGGVGNDSGMPMHSPVPQGAGDPNALSEILRNNNGQFDSYFNQ